MTGYYRSPLPICLRIFYFEATKGCSSTFSRLWLLFFCFFLSEPIHSSLEESAIFVERAREPIKSVLHMNAVTFVSQYESCKLWIDGLKSKSTKTVYAVHVSLFCKFHHTNPDELVKIKPDNLKDMTINYILE